MKPKAKTLIQRFGLSDPDLRSSVHDTMVLSLMDKNNMLDVLEATAWKNLSVEKPRCNMCRVVDGEKYCAQRTPPITTRLKNTAIEQLQEKHPDKTLQDMEIKVTIEHGSGFVEFIGGGWPKVGVEFEKSILDPALCRFDFDPINFNECNLDNKKHFDELCQTSAIDIIKSSDELKITPEYTITGYKQYVIGFIDFRVGLSHERMRRATEDGVVYYKGFIEKDIGPYKTKIYEVPTVFLEIKPEVKSFGETLRQINMYREFCKGEFVLVTGTDRADYNKAFNDAGVHVYHWT